MHTGSSCADALPWLQERFAEIDALLVENFEDSVHYQLTVGQPLSFRIIEVSMCS